MSSDLEARLKERLAKATEALKTAFGYSPGRWLQMEAKLGTLEACHRVLLIVANEEPCLCPTTRA